jgi:hypothetical protein
MRLLLMIALVLTSSTAAAQTLELPRARQGYYVALGGGGELTAASDDGESHTLMGFGQSLRLGQTITPHLGFGLRLDLGSGSNDDYDGSGGGLSLEGQWRVVGDLAVHVGAGFGFAGLTEVDKVDADEDDPGGYGALGALGLTYDWFFTSRASGGWALTPSIGARYLEAGGFDALFVGAGLQLTWWSGRPRQELELPEAEAYR